MTEYSRMAKGSFTSTGGAQVINLPFQPDYVEMTNVTSWKTPANHGVPFAKWDANFNISNVNYTLINVFNATPVLTTDTVVSVSGGITTFSAGQLLQFGPTLTVTVVTKAAAAQVTTSTAHNLTSGDVVILEGLYETSVTGMPQINGIPFTITKVDATNFTIPWNTFQSSYTAISGASTGTPRMKKVLYPYLYLPGTTVISAITLGTSTTVNTTNAHNFRVGQEVAFRIPQEWRTIELNSLPNTLSPGSPVYGYVTSVTNYNTVVVNINSSAMTAFNSNPTVAQTAGLSYAQIVAVGDVNTGGELISLNSALYPPPKFEPIGTTQFDTINGPAIRGAFVNNTSQGFIIGSGPGVTDTSAVLVGTTGNIIEWRALLHDMSIP